MVHVFLIQYLLGITIPAQQCLKSISSLQTPTSHKQLAYSSVRRKNKKTKNKIPTDFMDTLLSLHRGFLTYLMDTLLPSAPGVVLLFPVLSACCLSATRIRRFNGPRPVIRNRLAGALVGTNEVIGRSTGCTRCNRVYVCSVSVPRSLHSRKIQPSAAKFQMTTRIGQAAHANERARWLGLA